MPNALESPPMVISTPTALDVNVTNNVNVEQPGPALVLEFDGSSIPGTIQTIISSSVRTVPWRLRSVEFISRGFATFELKINSARVKLAKTSASQATIAIPFAPWQPVKVGDILELTYDQGDLPVVPITARIYYTENPIA